MLLRRFAVALALGLLLAPSLHAAPPPAEVARQLSKRAHEAYRAGNHREALDLLGAAYRLDPHPVLLYNMGRVLEAVDRGAALHEYRRCQERPGCPEAAAERVRILEAELVVPAARGGTPAPHAAAPPAASSARDERPPEPARGPSPWPWIVGAVGLAGVAAGLTTGLVASGRNDDARDEPAVGRARELHDQAEDLAVWANVGVVAGASLLLAGGVWAVIDLSTGRPGRDATTATSLRARGTSVVLRSCFW